MNHIPKLEAHCNSWIVTRKSDGKIIGEFWVRKSVELFNPDLVIIKTAAQHLADINK